MTNIEKIRTALDRCEPSRFPSTDNADYARMVRAEWESALAALAELERAVTEPVAWMWNDMLGIPHTYVSPKRPTWPDAGSSPAMAVAINVRPLYTTPPPAPVAEMREPTPEECREISRIYNNGVNFGDTLGTKLGRDAFDAVRAVMGGKS